MPKLSVRDLDLKNKRVFIRVDFNVPLAPGGREITSDKRIKASLPTIRYVLEQGAAVILASHLGRPKGKPNPEMSMKPVAKKLQELLGKPVGHFSHPLKLHPLWRDDEHTPDQPSGL